MHVKVLEVDPKRRRISLTMRLDQAHEARRKFDALFLADVLGVYDVYRGSPDAAIANAVQVKEYRPVARERSAGLLSGADYQVRSAAGGSRIRTAGPALRRAPPRRATGLRAVRPG